MLEAMSLGKAIISTTVGGAIEFLIDGENALLVRPEVAGDLAEALARLIEQPKLARKLGQNARVTYERHFTMERFGPQFRDLITELLARSSTERPRPSATL
jgi:glycosyltransferase involved in cell wall biosynthesis